VGIDPMTKNGKSSTSVRVFFTIGIKQEQSDSLFT
jgi:hypothetical protein